MFSHKKKMERKKYRERILAEYDHYYNLLEHVPRSLRNDKEFVLTAVKRHGCDIRFAHESLQKDRDIILAAVKQNACALLHVDKSIRNDREIVLTAIKHDGCALAFLGVSLSKNMEIVLIAVKNTPRAFQHAHESIRNRYMDVYDFIHKKSDERIELLMQDEVLQCRKINVLSATIFYF